MEALPPENRDLFQQHEQLINKEVDKRSTRWRLDALIYISWPDVRQMLLMHVARKIHLWNPEKSPLSHYLNRMLSNQIKNTLRNLYGSFQNPCIKCPHNLGGDRCSAFITQKNLACELFSHWEKNKRYKQEIAFAQSADANIPGEDNNNLKRELISRPCNFLDFDKKIPEFNNLLKQKLRPLEWKAYTLLFIEHLTDLQAARQLNYSTDGGKTSTGYKIIAKLKTAIYKKSQQVVKDMDF